MQGTLVHLPTLVFLPWEYVSPGALGEEGFVGGVGSQPFCQLSLHQALLQPRLVLHQVALRKTKRQTGVRCVEWGGFKESKGGGGAKLSTGEDHLKKVCDA